ncbi:hypothetical protein MASR2M79_23180 [Aminivibrio sp.]
MKKGRARRVKESAVTTIRCATKNMTRSSPPGIHGMKARQLNPMEAAMGMLRRRVRNIPPKTAISII